MKENTVRKELTTLIPFPTSKKLTKRQVDNRVRKCLALKEQEKELKAMRTAIEQELKEYMGDREKLETDNYRITYPRFSENRFNTTRFAKVYEDLYKAFCDKKPKSKFDYKPI